MAHALRRASLAAPSRPPIAGPRQPSRGGRWLLVVAAMIFVMVALGGATRLTGSGLSIMEWAPLSGTLPPLSEAEWQRLFDLYRTIPQYQLQNAGFGLEGFKRIFWLEWAHRVWGRLIGLAYLLPFLWFWARGAIPRGLLPRLGLLFLLGGMQGAIGWFMVASGFEADRTAVSPYRLVLHLSMAFLLFAAVLWTALDLLRPAEPQGEGAGKVRRQVQWRLLAGGGDHAGRRLRRRAARRASPINTFPLMDGPAGAAGLSRPFARLAQPDRQHRRGAVQPPAAGDPGRAGDGGRRGRRLRHLAPGFARRAVLRLRRRRGGAIRARAS
jgi:cytochrome c oxidase assembly protein subunit 15